GVAAGAPAAGAGVVPGRAPAPDGDAPAGPEPAGPSRALTMRACSTGPEPPAPPDIPRSAPTATAPWSAVWGKPPPPEASTTCPVVQGNNRIRTGSASRDRTTIVKPLSTVRGSWPGP